MVLHPEVRPGYWKEMGQRSLTRAEETRQSKGFIGRDQGSLTQAPCKIVGPPTSQCYSVEGHDGIYTRNSVPTSTSCGRGFRAGNQVPRCPGFAQVIVAACSYGRRRVVDNFSHANGAAKGPGAREDVPGGNVGVPTPPSIPPETSMPASPKSPRDFEELKQGTHIYTERYQQAVILFGGEDQLPVAMEDSEIMIFVVFHR